MDNTFLMGGYKVGWCMFSLAMQFFAKCHATNMLSNQRYTKYVIIFKFLTRINRHIYKNMYASNI
jgi:hypothetical protein